MTSILLGLFRPAVYSFPQWPGMATGFFFFLLMGSYVPFVFLLGILGPFAFFGLLGPFANFAFPWAFTHFIGFSRPNNLIFILRVHRPAINPLLS